MRARGGKPEPRRSVLRRPAFAAVFASLALLAFSWPLARQPSLPLERAAIHIFAAWCASVLLLGLMARALRPPRGPAGRRGDDG